MTLQCVNLGPLDELQARAKVPLDSSALVSWQITWHRPLAEGGKGLKGGICSVLQSAVMLCQEAECEKKGVTNERRGAKCILQLRPRSRL